MAVSDVTVTPAKLLGSDVRGWVIDPVDESVFPDRAIQSLHLVSLLPGAVRGNHVHALQHEYVCVLAGPIAFAYLDRDHRRHEQLLDPKTPVLVTLPPGTAHAFQNLGRQPVYLLCYADRRFDAAYPDAEPVELLPSSQPSPRPQPPNVGRD